MDRSFMNYKCQLALYKLKLLCGSLILLLGLLNLNSCTLEENPVSSPSALKMLGKGDVLDMSNIIPLVDGGFVVGLSQHKRNDSSYRLIRIDSEGRIIWDRNYETSGLGRLQSIFLNRDQEILLAGFCYGYEQDSIGLTESRTYQLLLMLVDEEGELIWKYIKELAEYDAQGLLIRDIVQDEKGDYLISTHSDWHEYDGTTLYSGNNGILYRIDANGKLLAHNVNRWDGGFSAVVDMEDSYGCFQFELGFPAATFATYDVNFSTGVDGYKSKKTIQIPLNVAIDGKVEGENFYLKRETSPGVFSLLVFCRANSFELVYDNNAAQFTMIGIPETLPEIIHAVELGNGELMLLSREGSLIRTSSELEILERNQPDLLAAQLAKLEGDKLALGKFENKRAFIYLSNLDGKARDL